MEKRPTKRRRYKVHFETEVVIEIDDDVLEDTQTQDWQDTFYKLDRKGIAGMLAINLHGGASLRMLDGFAHHLDQKARIVQYLPVDSEEVEELESDGTAID